MAWQILAAGALGAGASLLGSNKQAKAAKNAAKDQRQQYLQTRSDLLPYMEGGNLALSELNHLYGLKPRATAGLQLPTRDQFTTQRWIRNRQRGEGTQVLAGGPNGDWETNFDQGGYDSALADYNARMTAPPGDDFGSLTDTFGLDDFQESPAYRFNLEEGMDAITKGARARGKAYAPATLQDLGRYAQGNASNEFLNAYNMFNQDQSNKFNRLFGLSGMGQNAAAQTGAFGANAATQGGNAMMGAGNAQAAGLVGGSNAIAQGVAQYYNNDLLNRIFSTQRPTYGNANASAYDDMLNMMRN